MTCPCWFASLISPRRCVDKYPHDPMKRNLSHFFTLITLIVSVASAQATTTLNTVPEGLLSLDLPLVPKGTVLASNSSLPLIADPVYTGSVSSVTANTISVADNPAPFVNPTVGVQLGNLVGPVEPF